MIIKKRYEYIVYVVRTLQKYEKSARYGDDDDLVERYSQQLVAVDPNGHPKSRQPKRKYSYSYVRFFTFWVYRTYEALFWHPCWPSM